MKVRLFGIFIIVAGMLSVSASYAQDLPLLPRDPAVKSSILPNGLSCYVAENSSGKGVADFALIRRSYDGNDIIFSQEDVRVAKEVAVDSMLLRMMRSVDADRIPADCAIVVCGDVNAGTMMTKLKYMSLMVDSSSASPVSDPVWDGDSALKETVSMDSLSGLAAVRYEWQAPRTSRDKMNTTQAAIYEKTAKELGGVACRWIRRSLRKQDIPFADITFSQKPGEDFLSHEIFSFDVVVGRGDLERARNTVTSVLASLDSGGFCPNDLILAEREYMMSLQSSAEHAVISNSEYVQMCRNAFLYNRPLSSDRERLAFFSSKAISESSRRNMFSNIVSAMIEMDGVCDSTAIFASGVMLSDTLGFPGQSLKVKVRSSKKDTFSGGYQWTFANGFKVIYHKMASTDRKLYYSLSMNGGFGNISDLERGEAAYISDYMDLCWIAGMRAADFKDLLGLAGMTMDTKVRMFNTVLSGEVEDRNAPLMMKALLAAVNESHPDTSEMDYFSRCERLRISLSSAVDPRAKIDSLMCPGYMYSSFKADGGLGDRTFKKAEDLFASLTSKMNDGVLVVIGDMDEDELKKLLQLYVGDFKIRSIAYRRPAVQYHPVSGWSSYCVEGEKDAAVVAVSAPLVMNTTNHFAAEMAAMLLESRIKKELGPKGVDVQLSFTRSLYPDERFGVMVELTGDFSREDVSRLRGILSECQHGVSKEDLDFCKQYLKNAYTLQMKNAGYWMRVVPLRHLEGKDFTTGFGAKIDAVSLEALKRVFQVLADGAGIEYVTIKK